MKQIINSFKPDRLSGFIGGLFIALLLSSCVTTKKTTYIQGNTENELIKTTLHEAYKIQVSDNLFIKVITPDPMWATMFNSLPTTSSSITITEQSADIISYSVSSKGTIDMPYIGEIVVAGKTLQEINEILEKALVDYISDFDVTVKLVNNYVSLIGEVTTPGRYTIYKDQMTIFQALALANDVDVYSDRHEVQIIRETPDGTIVKDFNLTKPEIFHSDFYYVMPNDVIYVKPMKGKFFKMESFPFSTILSAISAFVLVYNVIE